MQLLVFTICQFIPVDVGGLNEVGGCYHSFQPLSVYIALQNQLLYRGAKQYQDLKLSNVWNTEVEFVNIFHKGGKKAGQRN